MPAYIERMPAGIPGDVSRKSGAHLEPNIVGATPVPYGAPVKLVSGKVLPVGAGDAATVVYGFLVRPYPTQGDSAALGGGTAPAGAQCDVLRSGYMTISMKGTGTPAKRDQVYVRVAAGGGLIVGDIVATADGANTIAVPGCVFMGAADAAGNTEIAYNI
jgi:hypothetical protein